MVDVEIFLLAPEWTSGGSRNPLEAPILQNGQVVDVEVLFKVYNSRMVDLDIFLFTLEWTSGGLKSPI